MIFVGTARYWLERHEVIGVLDRRHGANVGTVESGLLVNSAYQRDRSGRAVDQGGRA